MGGGVGAIAMGHPVHWHNQCYDTPVFTSLG